ncbi:hypothetical protein JS756_28730 [Streptomyces actuosus]|uniref:Thiopeptide-type bacteriocin biosynthesis domain-containing protein n=1 Tax=Streptomyces actuosus TaxID=1885 RepID=A0ABS2VXZ9_STRAS|nr:hypothetical protein [Streptomyces actuosus]MBN0048026.1 hypothetical protein [Streptomyces actuosus]
MDLPGRTRIVRVHDHSTDPLPLLRLLAGPLRELTARQWVPLAHVRRGWLGGSHLRITLRPLASNTLLLDDFAALAGRAARSLPATAPDEVAYRARAAELGRWENVPPPHPPLRAQGVVEVDEETGPPPGWTPALVDARDQLSSHLLSPLLHSVGAVPDPPAPGLGTGPADAGDGTGADGTDVLRLVTRVLALLARGHPYGLGVGTLPYRSHAEGVMSAVGGRTDLRAAFRERYARDREFFAAAVAEQPLSAAVPQEPSASAVARDPSAPGSAGAPPGSPVLAHWAAAFARCRGAAEAFTATGLITDETLGALGSATAPTDDRPVPNAFHTAAHHSGITVSEPYWQTAHRLVLNSLYSALTCLGVSPLRRYYLCYGVSEAADELLGETWLERMSGFAERELPERVRTAVEAAARPPVPGP